MASLDGVLDLPRRRRVIIWRKPFVDLSMEEDEKLEEKIIGDPFVVDDLEALGDSSDTDSDGEDSDEAMMPNL